LRPGFSSRGYGVFIDGQPTAIRRDDRLITLLLTVSATSYLAPCTERTEQRTRPSAGRTDPAIRDARRLHYDHAYRRAAVSPCLNQVQVNCRARPGHDIPLCRETQSCRRAPTSGASLAVSDKSRFQKRRPIKLFSRAKC
jgi:hypothetical protein